MRVVVRKWFWAWDFDKEEEWLNEMASKGLALVTAGLFCRYEFEETNLDYTIRIEFLEKMPGNYESQKYIRFLEDTGAEYLGGYLRWAFFRKKKSEGEFDIYSDYGSRIKHLSRIIVFITSLCLLLLVIGIQNIMLYFNMSHMILNLIIGCIDVLFGCFAIGGCFRIMAKKRKLQQEQQIHE